MREEMTPQTHCGDAGKAELACETCGTMFVPRRAWGRFCNDRCRNAFHASEARAEAIQAKATELYDALRQIADGGGPEIAAEAIKGLKPPESPKALLEKARA